VIVLEPLQNGQNILLPGTNIDADPVPAHMKQGAIIVAIS